MINVGDIYTISWRNKTMCSYYDHISKKYVTFSLNQSNKILVSAKYKSEGNTKINLVEFYMIGNNTKYCLHELDFILTFQKVK